MTVDVSKAFEVDQAGIALSDGNGNVVGYFTVGTGSPQGSPAPVNTWYFRQDTQTMWYKFGAADSDWRQTRAEDITFSQAIVDLGLDPADENVQKALESVGSGAGTGASPGFTCGKAGNVSNAFLDANSVPMDATPFPVGIAESRLLKIQTVNENVSTYDVEIYGLRPSTGLLELYSTHTVTAAKGANFFINTPFDTTKNGSGEYYTQWAAKVTNGSAKNVRVIALFKGDSE